MIRFKEGELSTLLLESIALSGEFPYTSLFLLGKNDRMIKRTVLKMKKEGYVTVIGNGPMKSIRITKKSFDLLEKMGLKEHYLTVSQNHHFPGQNLEGGSRQIWRNHRMAEAMILFRRLGVRLFPFEKPTLLNEKKKQISEDDAFFYTSTEIKSIYPKERLKVDFTRILGLLFTAGGMYSVYNTNKGLMKWHTQGEQKAKHLVSRIAYEKLDYKEGYSSDHALLFVHSMDVVSRILESNKKRKDSLGFEPLSFDNTFSFIHCVPISEEGLYLLYFLAQKDFKIQTAYRLFPSECILKKPSMECLAEKDNELYFLFIDGDVASLRRMKYQMGFLPKGKKIVVVCFSFQVDFIRNYLGNLVEIATIKEDELVDVF